MDKRAMLSTTCAAVFWAVVMVIGATGVLLYPLLLCAALLTNLCCWASGAPLMQHKLTAAQMRSLETGIAVDVCAVPVQHVELDMQLSLLGNEYEIKAHALRVRRGQRPTLVLVHGTGGTSLSAVAVLERLSAVFDVWAIDLPGFGRTCTSASPPPGEALDFHVAFLHAFLQQNGLHSSLVVGHSYGGFVAIHFASRFPTHVSHLLLLNPVGIFPMLGRWGAYWGFVFKYSLPQVGRHFGSLTDWALLTVAHAQGASFQYWYSVLGHPQQWGSQGLAALVDLTWTTCSWRLPALATLSRLSMPVATVYGEHDTIIPSTQGTILEQICGIPTDTLPDSGHSPYTAQNAENLTAAACKLLSQPNAARPQRNAACAQICAADWPSSFSATGTEAQIRAFYSALLEQKNQFY